MDRLTTPGETWHDCDFMDSGIAPYLNRLAAYEDIGTPEQLAARVEVVRCEDCKYLIYGELCDHEHWDCEGQCHAVQPDDFCSYGERRED